MSGWIFDRRTDLAVFGGSALFSFALLAWGLATGRADGPLSPLLWLAFVVLFDVGHVWATVWRVYLDPDERRLRPATYLGLPAAVYLVGVVVHAISGPLFWRLLAYAAVFHFIRQQQGWVTIARRRAGEADGFDRALDVAVVWAVTLYPVVWWHTHLPRAFSWFVEGDFLALPVVVDLPARVVAFAVVALWAARQTHLAALGTPPSRAKILVVATTAACWSGGIVLTNGDFAFTVTNVVIHAVPYFVLVRRVAPRAAAAPLALFLAVPLAFSFAEEVLWDRFVWEDHAALFGAWGGRVGDAALSLLVPLLALPQAVHYALDGIIWRARDNPGLVAAFAPPKA